MPGRRSTAVLTAASAAALLPLVAAAQKAPAVEDLLKAGGEYLATFAQQLGAAGADEEYTQYDMSSGRMGTPRRVNSSVVWLGTSGGVIDNFRDVVAIDRAPIRPKDDRLMALFQAPTGTSRSEARRLSESAVQQYLDANLHALDEPMQALAFLRAANQDRSTFKVEGTKKMDGTQVAVLRFTEKPGEPLVPSPEQTPATGRFWIDPASGTVHQTELALTGRSYIVRVTVPYALNAATSLWLPREMYQTAEVSAAGAADSSGRASAGYGGRVALEARATYTNFRHVAVDQSKLR
jgi:hypothetical protein